MELHHDPLVSTWILMGLLTLGAGLVTARLTSGPEPGRGQTVCESVVAALREQVRQVAGEDPDPYLPLVSTLFLFISASNLLGMVPGFHPPTASLSTTAALALTVFLATPLYGISRHGFWGYLAHYLEPTPLMLPFHVLGELTRTLALAVRLFGNTMSGTLIVGLLLSLTPLFFPVLMQLLELLIGQVQAYIFAVLATVYLASAARVQLPNKGGTHG